MATYGTRDATQFPLPSVESNERYYTLVDRDTGKITLKRISKINPLNDSLDATVGTIEVSGPNAGKFVPGAGATPTESQAFAQQPQAVKAVKDQATKTVVKGKVNEGTDPQVAQTEANKLLSPNSGSSPGTTPNTGDKAPKTADPNEALIKGTRTSYGDFKYPINLSNEHQDCIKFTILEYIPSLATPSSSSTTPAPKSQSREQQKGRTSLGTITLPIPAGINDGNSVTWQGDELGAFKELALPAISGFLSGGVEGATPGVNNAAGTLKTASGNNELRNAAISSITNSLLNTNNVQQRVYGSTFNNNLELLFNGPSLRSHSFTFKLSPREPNEAKEIMLIIRSFKQAMSVKRSASTLLLKTPRTFRLEYLTSNQEHPYLNKFKECALTSFNVDYTPEGQYMTYMSSNIDERSMISYVINLTFQELDPIFDDEYGNESLTRNSIKNIGY